MKTSKKHKLHLDRETIKSLQGAELDAVHGGIKETGCVSQCTACTTRPTGGGNGPRSLGNSLGGGFSLPQE
jgi:hypothetical protein